MDGWEGGKGSGGRFEAAVKLDIESPRCYDLRLPRLSSEEVLNFYYVLLPDANIILNWLQNFRQVG